MESRSETLSATDVVNNLQIRPCDRIPLVSNCHDATWIAVAAMVVLAGMWMVRR